MNTDYSTNLTDKQWQVIEKVINPQERARKHSLRDIMNAILYINKTGCQWRLLPREFGPWQTVYYYFRKWKLEGVFEDIMDSLHSIARKLVGRNESPSMGIIDSRSVKTSLTMPTLPARELTGTKRSRDARNILWLTHLDFQWR